MWPNSIERIYVTAVIYLEHVYVKDHTTQCNNCILITIYRNKNQ